MTHGPVAPMFINILRPVGGNRLRALHPLSIHHLVRIQGAQNVSLGRHDDGEDHSPVSHIAGHKDSSVGNHSFEGRKLLKYCYSQSQLTIPLPVTLLHTTVNRNLLSTLSHAIKPPSASRLSDTLGAYLSPPGRWFDSHAVPATTYYYISRYITQKFYCKPSQNS